MFLIEEGDFNDVTINNFWHKIKITSAYIIVDTCKFKLLLIQFLTNADVEAFLDKANPDLQNITISENFLSRLTPINVHARIYHISTVDQAIVDLVDRLRRE